MHHPRRYQCIGFLRVGFSTPGFARSNVGKELLGVGETMGIRSNPDLTCTVSGGYRHTQDLSIAHASSIARRS